MQISKNKEKRNDNIKMGVGSILGVLFGVGVYFLCLFLFERRSIVLWDNPVSVLEVFQKTWFILPFICLFMGMWGITWL